MQECSFAVSRSKQFCCFHCRWEYSFVEFTVAFLNLKFFLHCCQSYILFNMPEKVFSLYKGLLHVLLKCVAINLFQYIYIHNICCTSAEHSPKCSVEALSRYIHIYIRIYLGPIVIPFPWFQMKQKKSTYNPIQVYLTRMTSRFLCA